MVEPLSVAFIITTALSVTLNIVQLILNKSPVCNNSCILCSSGAHTMQSDDIVKMEDQTGGSNSGGSKKSIDLTSFADKQTRGLDNVKFNLEDDDKNIVDAIDTISSISEISRCEDGCQESINLTSEAELMAVVEQIHGSESIEKIVEDASLPSISKSEAEMHISIQSV